MSRPRIESVCVFGSSARGSADKLSDRDVLIVSNDKDRRDNVVAQWQQKGWSTAVYSPTRLASMIAAGSLFIQHLRLEGIILEDNNRWLRGALNKAKPKSSYEKDALDSISLALPIERFEGNASIKNNLITADLAYVSTRNFGICYLADQGHLSFEYSQVVCRLGEHFKLDDTEVSLLQSLRAGKAAYRGAVECPRLQGSVGELRSVLSKLFVNRPMEQIDHNLPARRLAGGYTMLRDFEASIVAELGRSPTEAELSAKGLNQIWKWVRDPRAYSWSVRNFRESDLEIDNLTIQDVSLISVKRVTAGVNVHESCA